MALPHPERAFQERAFVAVAVLKEPVFWFRQKVQVVFLTAIGREEDENLQQFYEATTDLILRPADVQNLIRHPDYDRLIQLLRRAEELNVFNPPDECDYMFSDSKVTTLIVVIF